MAWPSTPLTSYVAHSTPVIKAADLNSFQSGINGIINGTYSLAAFVVDGTGGMVTTPLAGSGTVSALLCSTGFPNPNANLGQFGVAGVPIGFAHINAGGGVLLNGYNVYRIDVNGTGDFNIVFNPVTTYPDDNFAFGSLTITKGFVIAKPYADGTGRQGVQVVTYDPAGMAANMNFIVGCWGE